MSSIRIFVENIVYYNEDSYYSVLEVSEGDELFTAVGYLPYISAGETLDAEGEYTVHPVYGKQFSVSSYQVIRPETADMIERYLSCGAVRGIGPALAKRIVRKFKADTFRIMEEEPERLAEIRGISEKTAMLISEQIELRHGFREAVMYMQQYGIGANLAGRIYECYGPAFYSVLEKNPYRLAEDVEGIGFRLADAIATRTGVPPDSAFRIRCGILYTLQEGVNQGHTWLPEHILTHTAAELLSLSTEQISEQLLDMHVDGKIVILDPMLTGERAAAYGASGRLEEASGDRTEEEPEILPGNRPEREQEQKNRTAPGAEEQDRQIYLAACYYVEKNIALRLQSLAVHGESEKKKITDRLRQICSETGTELDEHQEEAVCASVENGVLILTGGPGTGKTTTINSLIRYYSKEHRTILLAAPTGRAAKRMSEASGCEAKTIHRLLEYTGAPEKKGNPAGFGSAAAAGEGEQESFRGGRGKFLRNEKDPLECDVLIVDEMSMVDIFLMDALLKAVVPGTRLVLVGDANQLPSVGAGNVLRDLIASGAYRTVCLTRIFRQAAESDIILNAHRINRGEPVDLSKKSRDFIFIRSTEPGQITDSIRVLITKKLPAYVGTDTLSIQVLTPTRKGALGVEELNRGLQDFLNPQTPQKREKKTAAGVFREGDKVMQIRNNYDLEWEKYDEAGAVRERGTGVYNGDLGRILSIDPDSGTLTVLFDDERTGTYGAKEQKELELAYAVTVHKSQGSEYPAVVIPVYYGPSMLMNRNLLYTAVTRARKCVCLVGIPAVFERMEENRSESSRWSGLKDRIRECAAEMLP